MKKQLENFYHNNILLSSCLSKIRGFTVDLLYHLEKAMLRTSDLVEITGKYRQYINRYLYNMQKYGLVEKQGVFWKITENGVYLLNHFRKVSTHRRQRRKIEERKKKDGRKIEESCVSNKPKQVSIQLFLQKLSLSEAENRIIEILYKHYIKTGSLFIYFPMDIYQDPYQAAEYFKIRPDQVVPAFRRLKQDRIAYKIWDRRYSACKVALYKAFVETLELEATASKEASEG